jgi:hypothetical protein
MVSGTMPLMALTKRRKPFTSADGDIADAIPRESDFQERKCGQFEGEYGEQEAEDLGPDGNRTIAGLLGAKHAPDICQIDKVN